MQARKSRALLSEMGDDPMFFNALRDSAEIRPRALREKVGTGFSQQAMR
jgi:hypothetical protein